MDAVLVQYGLHELLVFIVPKHVTANCSYWHLLQKRRWTEVWSGQPFPSRDKLMADETDSRLAGPSTATAGECQVLSVHVHSLNTAFHLDLFSFRLA